MSEGAHGSSLDLSIEANNDDNNISQTQSQQLEDEDRLSVLTDDNCPWPPERFEDAQVSLDKEANNDNNSSQSQQLEDEDRLSTLTDDILLTILGRVSLHEAASTCLLSTRWRHLPWLLPELSIDIRDFLPVPHTEPIEANDMEELAMVSLTKATRSFLADPQRESSISTMELTVYLINTLLCEIGPLVCDAIESGLLKDLELTILDEREPVELSFEDRLQRAQEIDTFFSAYPSVFGCLTKLCLYNANFEKLDMHHVLFDCCKQLEHLSLFHCDIGAYSVFKIDAPNSKLWFLEAERCRFERIELVCLPKLEKFVCFLWESVHFPVIFGFVPSLEKVELSCGATNDLRPFKLSELLHGTSLRNLRLNFLGEILWLQPELEELRTAFSKLKKLSLWGIFVEFDILWTTAFLVAAPSIERLCIEAWEHACDVSEEYRAGAFDDRVTPQWDMRFNGSENRPLKVLVFCGFRSLEQQFTFIRAMLERSPNLQKIVLRGAVYCEACDALDHPSKFPRAKDDQEMVVKRIRGGIFSPEIIFDEDSLLKI